MPGSALNRSPEPDPCPWSTCGRLDDNKSTITAVEALSLTDQPHHLTVIGEGTLQEHLQQRAVELGLRDRVHFVPFLPRAELWRLLPDFDAFVFTTTGLEAFGLVLIEAQAHGLPVVYSNLPGVKETLGGAGVPYTPGVPRSLTVALDGMGRAPHRRKALSKAALDNARRYDIAATGHAAPRTDHPRHLLSPMLVQLATGRSLPRHPPGIAALRGHHHPHLAEEARH